MKNKWTSKLAESKDPLNPFQALAVSPTGSVQWIGNYPSRRRAQQEGRAVVLEKAN